MPTWVALARSTRRPVGATRRRDGRDHARRGDDVDGNLLGRHRFAAEKARRTKTRQGQNARAIMRGIVLATIPAQPPPTMAASGSGRLHSSSMRRLTLRRVVLMASPSPVGDSDVVGPSSAVKPVNVSAPMDRWETNVAKRSARARLLRRRARRHRARRAVAASAEACARHG